MRKHCSYCVRDYMTRMKRITRSDGDQTSRDILEAAGPLFAQAGFAETTAKTIAERAGADVASINYHFGGRAQLYQATLLEAHRRLVSLSELEVLAASNQPAMEKFVQLLDILLDVALQPDGWPAHLLAREVLSPSSHFQVVLDAEIEPKLAVVQRILSEATGIPAGDPALLRCIVSVAAPCLMLAVAASGVPGPVRTLRQMSREDLSAHMHIFATAGVAAVAHQWKQTP